MKSVVSFDELISKNRYCDQTCYSFTFWIITIVWIMSALCCCFLVCLFSAAIIYQIIIIIIIIIISLTLLNNKNEIVLVSLFLYKDFIYLFILFSFENIKTILYIDLSSLNQKNGEQVKWRKITR